MRILPRAVVAVALMAAPMISSTAGAQALAPVAARYTASTVPDTLRQETPTPESKSDFDGTVRVGLGIVGAFAGAFTGGMIGGAMGAGCHGDMCGLGNVLGGAAIGSVAIATMLSAGPSLSSKCTQGGREALALGGGVVGALVGGAIGLIGGPLSILTYVVGGGIGAGAAAASC